MKCHPLSKARRSARLCACGPVIRPRRFDEAAGEAWVSHPVARHPVAGKRYPPSVNHEKLKSAQEPPSRLSTPGLWRPHGSYNGGRVAKVGRWDTVVDLRLRETGISRRPDEQGSIFSCQATLPRAGTHILKEPNAARQALAARRRNLGSHSLQETGQRAARPRRVPECTTSRAHNASFRHFNPPFQDRRELPWASFGTFPWGRIGNTIGFHASGLATGRWWHKPVEGRRIV